MLIVLVKFRVGSPHSEPFRVKLKENARTSLQETQCHRFDLGEVFLADQQLYEFVLYEEYSDRAAFDFHLTTDHFLNFNSETQDMVIAKEIQFYQLINHVEV